MQSSLISRAANAFPSLKLYGIKLKYRSEACFDARRFISNGKPSILVFTLHKCASTFITPALKYINKHIYEGVYLDLANYFWNTANFDVYEFLSQHPDLYFSSTGCLYGPLRDYVEIPYLEKYKSLVIVRDPRDVLVSHYYSIAISHNLPANKSRRREFLVERRRVNDMPIDSYALWASPRFKSTYQSYASLLQRGATLLRYEDLIADPANWLKSFIEATGLDPSERAIRDLIKLGRFNEKVPENSKNHLRQKHPGDHANKLSRETIRELDLIWRSELSTFRYQ